MLRFFTFCIVALLTLVKHKYAFCFAEQLFDYLIVIDFESTCWNDGKHHQSQEISMSGLPGAKASPRGVTLIDIIVNN